MMTPEQLKMLKVGDLVIVDHGTPLGHSVAKVTRQPGNYVVAVSIWRLGLSDWRPPEVLPAAVLSSVDGNDAEPIARALFEAGCRLRDAQNTAAGQYEADVAMIARGEQKENAGC